MLKVFGGNLRGTHRGCIAAKSKAEAVRLIQVQHAKNFTMTFFRDFWSVTGNPDEVRIATAEPGVLFVTVNHKRNYRRAS